MKTGDLIELAARNLRQAALRNTLTTAGIAVGVASLVAMLSLGIGLQTLANKQFKKSGLFDTIFVTPKNDPREMERNRRQGEQIGEVRPLTQSARAEIAKLPEVVEAYPEIRFYSDVRMDGKPFPTTVSALPESSRQREAFDTMKGHFFSSPDADEAIVHQDYAKQLTGGGNPANAIGKELVLQYFQHGAPVSGGGSGPEGTAPQGFQLLRKQLKVKIVGVIDTDPLGGFMGSNARIWIPSAVAESLHAAQPADMRSFSSGATQGEGQFPMLFVRVKSAKNTTSVEENIKKMGFSAESLLDASKSLQRFFAVLDGFLGIFGSLALAVASLGIINTLVMSILERRREIGIMKAVGASDADVQTLFFAEAASMGLVGGALGVVLGWIIGKGINLGFDAYLHKNQIPTQEFWLLPLWLVLAAIAFSVCVSLAAGFYPARRAARLDPVQALRYD